MTAEVVPLGNVAAIEALDPAAREVAVTRMLSEARSWLAHAVEATEPTRIAEFKAFMATVAEATKQLDLSKEIQLDAQEMVRRAERGMGLAIRRAQSEGTVTPPSRQVGRQPLGHREQMPNPVPRPVDIVGSDQERTDIYQVTDDVTDEQFERAIEQAKAEGNLSRANVVRKVKGEPRHDRLSKSPKNTPAKAEAVRLCAQRGMRSAQIAKQLGFTVKHVKTLARDHGIEIVADKVVGRSYRIDSTRVVNETVAALDALVFGVRLIDFQELDPAEAANWAASLTESIRALNRFAKQIKELAQ